MRPVTAGRAHLRNDGRPKVAYPTLGEAAEIAHARSTPGGVRFVAYRCPYCPAFHVGRLRLRPSSASDADWIELGDRVVWHLRRENRRPVPRLRREAAAVRQPAVTPIAT